jgi:hypothetical protein
MWQRFGGYSKSHDIGLPDVGLSRQSSDLPVAAAAARTTAS